MRNNEIAIINLAIFIAFVKSLQNNQETKTYFDIFVESHHQVQSSVQYIALEQEKNYRGPRPYVLSMSYGFRQANNSCSLL